MTLREQILELGERKVNAEYVKSAGFINTIEHLARLAFIDEWEEGIETRAIRHGCLLLRTQAMVPEDEPAVTE